MADGLFNCCTSRPYLGAPSDFSGAQKLATAGLDKNGDGKLSSLEQAAAGTNKTETSSKPIEETNKAGFQTTALSSSTNIALAQIQESQ